MSRCARLSFSRSLRLRNVAFLTAALPVMLAACSSTPPEPEQRLSLYALCPRWRAIESTIRYPASAIYSRSEGVVVVAFTIQPTGDIGDVEVVRSAGLMLNGAMLDAISLLKCLPSDHATRVQVQRWFQLR
jgi:TonB family protein